MREHGDVVGGLLVWDREYGTAVTGQARENNLGRAHHRRRTVGVACDTIVTPLVRSKVSLPGAALPAHRVGAPTPVAEPVVVPFLASRTHHV